MKLGVAKTGNIASSMVLELLLDELAERKDLEVQTFGSGAKMTPDACRQVLSEISGDEFDLIVYVTPNPTGPGPKELIEGLNGKPVIVVSDSTGIKMKERLEGEGVGYVFITGDAMIGARREFLDSIEMSIFNGHMLTVLSVTGALRALQEALDEAISSAKKGSVNLPRMIVDGKTALEYSGLKNPYAIAKAMAAYEMAEKVAKMNVKACFVLKDSKEYIPLAAASHEMARDAAWMADEAREMEKGDDSVLRRPHSPEGKQLEKRALLDKPK